MFARIQQVVVKKGYGDQAEANKQGGRVSTLTYGAMKSQTNYAGHLNVFLPAMVYQAEGNRLVAFISLLEIIDMLAMDSEASETLGKLDPQQLMKDWLTVRNQTWLHRYRWLILFLKFHCINGWCS